MPLLRLDAKKDQLEILNNFIAGSVSGSFSGKLEMVQLAAEELFVNVYSHAGAAEEAQVQFECGEKIIDGEPCLFLRMSDSGPPFNPFEQAAPPDLTSPVETRPLGGLGIYLIKSVTASQKYERSGSLNIVELCFNRDG